ncbi:MAG: transcriptional repressor [Phycisphaeraceae bacterium]|nr:transcriptional repressor [Phycisphaeraceae bacterium]MBX3367376.1 transcriptional repressor [Phycisphaeraceae bacterium]
MRSTRQRGAILRTLERSGRPLSAAEVLTLARTEVPGLGLATVYRTIDSLVASGAIACVEIPGKSPRFEIAGKDHHHHFLCKACHKVFEVHGCPGNIDAHVPRGFVLEGHELTLFGLCGTCAEGRAETATPLVAKARRAKAARKGASETRRTGRTRRKDA